VKSVLGDECKPDQMNKGVGDAKWHRFYFVRWRGAKYCDLCVCVSVCLFTYLKNHVKISPNFPYVLPMAVARSSSDDNAIRYVLPVLWMTSCFHKMDQIQSAMFGGQEGKLSGLFCAILCATIVHSAMHTHMNRANRSLDWVLSHWAHFTVRRFIFVCVLF